MRKFLNKVVVWVRKHWKLVAGVVVLLLVSVVAGKKGIYEYKYNRLRKEQDRLTALQRDIAVLEARRDGIRKRGTEVEEEVKKIDSQIAKLETGLVARRAEVNRMTAEEKLNRFKELGY